MQVRCSECILYIRTYKDPAEKNTINLGELVRFVLSFAAFLGGFVLFRFRQVGWVIYSNKILYEKAFSATFGLIFLRRIINKYYFTIYFIVILFSAPNNWINKLFNLSLISVSLERKDPRTAVSTGEITLGILHK